MNEKMTLQDWANLLAERSQMEKKDAETFLKTVFETVDEALLAEQSVKIKNLGTFKLTSVSERESVDVTTGERLTLPAHYKVNFAPDTALSETVNEPFALFETTELEGDATSEQPTENPKISDEKIPAENLSSDETEGKTPTLTIILSIAAGVFVGLLIYWFALRPMWSPSAEEEIAQEAPTELVAAESAPTDSVVAEQAPAPEVIAETAPTTKRRTIRTGERLTVIALEEYGNKVFWVYLFEENKDVLKHPNQVQAGQVIAIPSAEKYGIDAKNAESLQKASALAAKLLDN